MIRTLLSMTNKLYRCNSFFIVQHCPITASMFALFQWLRSIASYILSTEIKIPALVAKKHYAFGHLLYSHFFIS